MEWIHNNMVEEAQRKAEGIKTTQYMTEEMFLKLRYMPNIKGVLIKSKNGRALGHKLIIMTWFTDTYVQKVLQGGVSNERRF